MGSSARKLQTNQREKPRDLSVDFALPYPVECPALGEYDEIVYAASLAFFPQFLRGDLSRIKLHFTTTNGSPWPAWNRRLTWDLVNELWVAHLSAGETSAQWPIPYEGLIYAIGARFQKDEQTFVLNLDLDGHGTHYDASEIVRLFESVGVCGLLTSSSGKPGKFRYLVLLDRWYTIDKLRELAKLLCKCLGLKVGQGFVEIFPAFGNGRLPGGYGALTVHDPANLDVGKNLKLPGFLRTFFAQPRVELARIVDELKRDQPITCEIIAANDAGNPSQAERESGKQASRKRKKTRVPEHVARILEHGAEPGQRFPAIQALVKHAWFQKMNRIDACKFVGNWVHQGGIARTNLMRERDDAIDWQLKDLPRIVDGIYELPAEKRRSKLIEDPAHLSAADVLLLNADVERVVAGAIWPRRIVEAFAMASFCMFKGSCIAGKLDDQGRAKAQLHRDRWEEFASGRADYRALRDAFGIFEPISRYMTKEQASVMYGDESYAHARTYALNRPLTQDAPKVPLGKTWSVAVMRARKARKKA